MNHDSYIHMAQALLNLYHIHSTPKQFHAVELNARTLSLNYFILLSPSSGMQELERRLSERHADEIEKLAQEHAQAKHVLLEEEHHKRENLKAEHEVAL